MISTIVKRIVHAFSMIFIVVKNAVEMLDLIFTIVKRTASALNMIVTIVNNAFKVVLHTVEVRLPILVTRNKLVYFELMIGNTFASVSVVIN